MTKEKTVFLLNNNYYRQEPDGSFRAWSRGLVCGAWFMVSPKTAEWLRWAIEEELVLVILHVPLNNREDKEYLKLATDAI